MDGHQGAPGSPRGASERGLRPAEKTEPFVGRGVRRPRQGGLVLFDPDSKMESVTTTREAFRAPTKPAARTRGIRRELLEKQMARIICQEKKAAMNPPTPKADYRTTTQEDFSAPGFVPLAAETTTNPHGHDSRTHEAITFWSEHRQQIQGVTSSTSFRKSAMFSTPIGERLDEEDD